MSEFDLFMGRSPYTIGNPQQIIEKYSKLHTEDPTDFEAISKLICAYIDLDFKTAELMVTSALKTHPLNSTTHELSAWIHVQKGENELALKECDRAIELDSKNGSVYGIRADLKDSSGDITGAISDLEKAVHIIPPNKGYYLAIIALKEQLGDLEGALQYADKMVESVPKEPLAYEIRGYIKNMLGDVSGAMKDYMTQKQIEEK